MQLQLKEAPFGKWRLTENQPRTMRTSKKMNAAIQLSLIILHLSQLKNSEKVKSNFNNYIITLSPNTSISPSQLADKSLNHARRKGEKHDDDDDAAYKTKESLNWY